MICSRIWIAVVSCDLPDMRDVHMLEIFSQLKLSMKTDLHYLFHIEEFLRSKNTQSPWLFRVREDGKFKMIQGTNTGSTNWSVERL